MVYSVTSLLNRSLALLGEAPISDVSEETESARRAVSQYEHTVDLLLSSFNWSFASVPKHSLALLGDVSDIPPWSHRYALPSDCLRPIRVYVPSTYQVILHDFARHKDGLYTDTEGAYLSYTARVGVETFPAYFVEALVQTLAYDLSAFYGRTGAERQAYGQDMQKAVGRAKFTDSKQGCVPTVGQDALLESRGGYRRAFTI
jgi:hypothetical protein